MSIEALLVKVMMSEGETGFQVYKKREWWKQQTGDQIILNITCEKNKKTKKDRRRRFLAFKNKEQLTMKDGVQSWEWEISESGWRYWPVFDSTRPASEPEHSILVKEPCLLAKKKQI